MLEGRMMRPLNLLSSVPFIQSLAIRYPSVMISAWKKIGEENSLAVFVGNADSKNEHLSVQFSLDFSLYHFFPSQFPLQVFLVSQNGTRTLFDKVNHTIYNMNSKIAKRDVQFFLFTNQN